MRAIEHARESKSWSELERLAAYSIMTSSLDIAGPRDLILAEEVVPMQLGKRLTKVQLQTCCQDSHP